MKFGKLKPAYGRVIINPNWCKGCGFCVAYCPTGALEMSEGYNAKGYHPPMVKSAEDCRDCKFCEKVCPEFAIFVTSIKDEVETSGTNSN
jgi:2-oxoglutarate ferredoxin oxidoreductase subunit delta